jgi:hypothetical protein
MASSMMESMVGLRMKFVNNGGAQRNGIEDLTFLFRARSIH